ncbi:MAG: hypothetical protein ACYC1M_18940 [Armatimonadota bacterium]
MNKWISIIRQSIRAKHEHRLLVQAMRNDPLPAPSEGLKQRLLADAAAASRLSHVQVKRPNLLWTTPAAVLAVALIGFVWGVVTHRDDSVSPARIAQKPARVPTRFSVVKPTVIPEVKHVGPAVQLKAMLSTVKSVAVPHRYPVVSPQQPQRVERVVALRQIASVPPYTPFPTQSARTDQYVVEQRLEKPNSIRSLSTVDQNRVSATNQFALARTMPSIKVSIGYAADDEIGYAYASAWSTDKDGHRVKTEWSITYDPYAQRTQEEVLVSGSRQTPSLKVTVVTSLRRDE